MWRPRPHSDSSLTCTYVEMKHRSDAVLNEYMYGSSSISIAPIRVRAVICRQHTISCARAELARLDRAL